MDRITRAARRTREAIQDKSHISGWVLPKQQTSYAPDGTWTNIDLDVTPTERRIWTKLSMLGYWVSDIVCVLATAVRQMGELTHLAVDKCTR